MLVATATLAWGVNLPAHLVIVKGTEYFDGKLKRYVDFDITDVLQMTGRAGAQRRQCCVSSQSPRSVSPTQPSAVFFSFLSFFLSFFLFLLFFSPGRPQFDDEGVAVIFVHDAKKDFYKKFMHEPFPVESSLHTQLANHFNAEIVAGTITSKQVGRGLGWSCAAPGS